MAIVKEVQFNDGEGLVSADLNNVQRFLRSQVGDGLLGRVMRTNDGTAGTLDTICYSQGAGGHIRAPGVALQSSNFEGLLCQKISNATPDGSDSKVLSYYVAQGDLDTTHAAAHATLERWDTICIKLDNLSAASASRDFKDATTGALTTTTPNKERQVRLQKQVVVGANAAVGTAVEGAIPAGYCRWAAVLIPPTFAGNFDATVHYRDWRVPLANYSDHIVMPNQFNRPAAGFPTQNAYSIQATAAGQAAYFIMPPGLANRIVSFDFQGKISTPGTIELYRATGFTGVTSSLTLLSGGGHTGGVYAVKNLVAAGATSFGLLQPVWGRGFPGGPAANVATDAFLLVSIVSGASGDYINYVNFQTWGP